MKKLIRKINKTQIPLAVFVELMEAGSSGEKIIPPMTDQQIADLPQGTVALTDAPFNQGMVAAMRLCNKKYPDAQEAFSVFESFMFRSGALFKAVASGKLADYRRGEGESLEMHGAVLIAAGESPLNYEGEFDHRFFDKVKALYSQLESTQPE